MTSEGFDQEFLLHALEAAIGVRNRLSRGNSVGEVDAAEQVGYRGQFAPGVQIHRAQDRVNDESGT